jgi:cation diffusion facilitator family transporter
MVIFMKDPSSSLNAVKSKQGVAFSSVCAAILLTGTKLTVGLLTGSLGLLSEAAHSALDLVAAIVTFFAVRVSDTPADKEHPYGHGKVENLSALIETALLMITCIWIIKEAIVRLFFQDVPVDVTIWSFLVILLSIVVDISRSRALMRVAKKHQSQALEADALHFGTDVWSSCVVLAGLLGVKIGQWTNSPQIWEKADAIAALGVAVIVIKVSINLGRRSVGALLDKAPDGISVALEETVRQTDGVLQCGRIRVRQSGAQTFADVVIGVNENLPVERSHAICAEVERRIQELMPHADVVLHVDPVSNENDNLTAKIHSIASATGYTVHNIIGYKEKEKLIIDMHLESDENKLLEDAHSEAGELKAEILKKIPGISDLTIHMEPRHLSSPLLETTSEESDELLRKVKSIVSNAGEIRSFHKIALRKHTDRTYLSMHCLFTPGVTLREVAEITNRLETQIRAEIPGLERITIHSEPESNGE